MLYRHGSAKKRRLLHSWSNGKKVCIDMKEALRKAAEALFPRAKVVADPFQVIADSNKRMDEARRIEQDVHWRRRVNPSRPVLPELVPTGVEGAEGPVVSLSRISLRGGAEPSGRVKIPKKIFLIGGEKLGEQAIRKVDQLLDKYPGLKGFYWDKETRFLRPEECGGLLEEDAPGVCTIS